MRKQKNINNMWEEGIGKLNYEKNKIESVLFT